MCKFGRLIEKKSSEIISTEPFHILCANHGFHLCTMDVTYKMVAKNEENVVEEHNEENDEENEENFDYLATETSELIPELKVLIQIVRKHVKHRTRKSI